MSVSIFPTFVILLMVLNPFSCLAKKPGNFSLSSETGIQMSISTRCFWAVSLLLATIVLGQTLMQRSSLSLASIEISSGMILFLLSVKMIFSEPEKNPQKNPDWSVIDIKKSISQLVFTAGPTTLANVLLLSACQIGHSLEMAIALICAILVGAMLIMLSFRLQTYAGFSMALHGCQKLMGLILTALAIDRILLGIQHYV